MITSIEDLTLDKFKKCLFKGDTTVLGIAPKKDRDEAWNKIYMEYADALIDDKQKHILKLQLEHKVLSSKITLINSFFNYVKLGEKVPGFQYDQGVFDKMIEIGAVSYSVPVEDPEKQKAWFTTLTARGKRWVQRQKEIEILLPKIMPDDNKVSSSEDFDTMLTVLSRHFNTFIQESQCTVSRYCTMVKLYRLEAAQQEVK